MGVSELELGGSELGLGGSELELGGSELELGALSWAEMGLQWGTPPPSHIHQFFSLQNKVGENFPNLFQLRFR